MRTSSTSAALMFSPPRMMTSEIRSVMERYPSASSTPMSPVWYQPSASNTFAVSDGVGVSQEAFRSPREDLAGLPGRHLPALGVHELDLTARQRPPSRRQALLQRVVVRAARDGGMLGGSVHRIDAQADLRGPLHDRPGHGSTPHPLVVQALEVLLAAARMIEQAGQEVGRAATSTRGPRTRSDPAPRRGPTGRGGGRACPDRPGSRARPACRWHG